MALYDNDITNARLDKQAAEKKMGKVYSTKVIEQILDDIHKGYQADMTPFARGHLDRREPQIIFEYTDWEQEELLKCMDDCVYFVENYVKFVNDKGRTLVKLRDYQIDFLRKLSEEYYDEEIDELLPKNTKVVSLMSRQASKTSTVCAFLTWYTIFHNNKKVAIIANKGDTGKQILGLVQAIFDGLPFFMKPGIINSAVQTITLENGCVIKTYTTNPTAATGSTINLLYLDEFAHIPNNIADEFWKSVYPTLSSFKAGQIVITSTPKGKNNLFYKLYNGAVTKQNGFLPIRVDWWQVPGHDEKWKEETIKAFGRSEFEREFGLSFDTQAVKLLRGEDYQYIRRVSTKYIQHDIHILPPDIQKCLWWHPNFIPENLVNRRFLFVVDTAEGEQKGQSGKEDPDFNVINIFECELMNPVQVLKNRSGVNAIDIKDVFRYKQVGIYVDREHDEEQAAIALSHIVFDIFGSGRGMIDNCRILLEMNFNGKNFINIFKKHNCYYDAVVLKTYHSKPNPGEIAVKKPGFRTTHGEKGKSYWCELGAKMIMNRQIIITQTDDNINYSTTSQIENFGKNGKKYEGIACHDDIAITVLFLSHIMDIPEFFEWLDEYMNAKQTYKTSLQRIVTIYELLKKYVDDEDKSWSDSEFNTLYSSFGNTNNISRTVGIGSGYSQYSTYGSMNRGTYSNYSRMVGSPATIKKV